MTLPCKLQTRGLVISVQSCVQGGKDMSSAGEWGAGRRVPHVRGWVTLAKLVGDVAAFCARYETRSTRDCDWYDSILRAHSPKSLRAFCVHCVRCGAGELAFVWERRAAGCRGWRR